MLLMLLSMLWILLLMLWMLYGMVGEGMGGKESGRVGEGKEIDP